MPEIDNLDIDDLIAEAEKEEKSKTTPKKEEKIKETPKEPDKEKKKKKLPIYPISWVILLILIIFLSYLTFIEVKKVPKVKSGYLIIKKKIIYITPQKIQESKIKTYNFNLTVAYKFPSIKGAQILKATLSVNIHSKAIIPMKKLYYLIKSQIYKDFNEISKNKYLEDIPFYKNKIKEIILRDTLSILKNTIPDIDMKEIGDNLKFIEFILFSG